MSAARIEGRSFQIPRAVLIGMWGLVLFAIAVTGLTRVFGGDKPPRQGDRIASRDIRVADRSDGSVLLLDAVAGQPIATLDPGTSGFIRATLRGLARERKRAGAGPETPFRLTHWADGHLTLDDLETGRQIDLGAFGITNAQAFARLIEFREKRQ